jgi:hypothetical protein
MNTTRMLLLNGVIIMCAAQVFAQIPAGSADR